MNQKVNKVTPWAVLSISFVLTSGLAINGTLPLMKEQLDLSQTQSELLGTIPSLTVFIFVLLSNWIISQIGMKKTVLTGLFLVVIGGVFPVFVPNNYHAIFLSRLVLGAGLGFYNSSAVNYINELFTGKERMNLLGLRNSMESIGQMVLTFMSGLLIAFGWHYSYLIYLAAVPIGLLFYRYVPEVEKEENKQKESSKLTWLPFLSMMFASLVLMNSIAIAIRFPALAIHLNGPSFNTSNYLAMMPILGIVAGFLFQKIASQLGHRILYLAVFVNLLANVFTIMGNSSFIFLVFGLLISSIPVAWVLPYLFNHVERLANGMSTRLLTSIIFLGCNFGVFITPILMQFISFLGQSESLYFPFYIFTIMSAVLLVVLILNHQQNKKTDVS